MTSVLVEMAQCKPYRTRARQRQSNARFAAAQHRPCFTPVNNLELNGMSEVFVEKFKRDNLRIPRRTHLPCYGRIKRRLAVESDRYGVIDQKACLETTVDRALTRGFTALRQSVLGFQ